MAKDSGQFIFKRTKKHIITDEKFNAIHKSHRISYESLDFTDIYIDLFKEYTKSATLEKIKTTSLGSLFVLYYNIVLKNYSKEKECIDALRCRNGNLTISL